MGWVGGWVSFLSNNHLERKKFSVVFIWNIWNLSYRWPWAGQLRLPSYSWEVFSTLHAPQFGPRQRRAALGGTGLQSCFRSPNIRGEVCLALCSRAAVPPRAAGGGCPWSRQAGLRGLWPLEWLLCDVALACMPSFCRAARLPVTWRSVLRNPAETVSHKLCVRQIYSQQLSLCQPERYLPITQQLLTRNYTKTKPTSLSTLFLDTSGELIQKWQCPCRCLQW